MLRLLGFVFLLLVCIGTAPWGLVVGAVLCVAWLFDEPVSWSRWRAGGVEKSARSDFSVNAVSLIDAVYCANCDQITDSPHEACRCCGSHSIIAVSRLWQLAVVHAPATEPRHKISFTAQVRDIPANGLSEAMNLIVRLSELGGETDVFHIQVDEVETREARAETKPIELVKAKPRSTHAWDRAARRAS